MHQRERRAEPRIAVNFQGTLAHGDTSVPCSIQNMCSRGFLIKQTKDLPVGQIVRLKFELYPRQPIECTVQIRHVNAQCSGARVIEISDEGKMLCQRYLQEHKSKTKG